MDNDAKFEIKTSDVISAFALIVSILAAFFTYNANERIQKIDNDAAMVAVQSIGNSIKELAVNAKMSYLFLNGFNEHIKAHPEDSTQVERLRIDFIKKNDISKFSVSQDVILLIAKSDVEAAKKITKCFSLSKSLDTDLKHFSDAISNTLSTEQLINLNVIPFRFFKLSEACSDAESSLVKYLNDKEPLKGTLGELIAAQQLEYKMKNDNDSERVSFSLDHKK